MDNFLDNWSKLKKVTEEYTRIPINYILFIILNVLIYFDEERVFSSFITSNSLIKEFLGLILHVTSKVYDNISMIFLVITIIACTIFLIFGFTPFFNLLPKDVEYVDGYIESWNPVSAIKRLFNLIISLSTSWFIIYSLILFIVYPKSFSLDNKYVVIERVGGANIINVLWSINYVVLFFLVIKSLFVIKYRSDKHYLKLSDFRHIIISSFNVSNEYETNCTMIVKDTYDFKQYYLLEGQTHRRVWKERSISRFGVPKEQEFYWQKEAIPISKRSYKILDKSENLSDLVYYYDELKQRRPHDKTCFN